MKIAVLLKLVPDLVEDLEVDSSGKALEEEFLKLKLNEFDDHALEEAILLKEEGVADEIIAFALEDDEVARVLYSALAKGADRAVVLTGARPKDTHQTARAFANVLATGAYDLILTGVQSPSDRDGQLAPILAAYLDLPCVSVVNGMQVVDRQVIVRKEYSGGMLGKFEVDLPAVIGVQAARKTPRYAPVSKIRQVQQTMQFEELPVGDVGPGSGTQIEQMAPPERGEGAQMLDSVDDLLEVLKEKGVI
jgi:electron transfer flavoprotein beta subunit